MELNDKGFSLVELLVIIGMLAIISSGAFMGFNTIYNANVNNSASTINSTLSAVRMNNMSKIQVHYLHIYRVDGFNYYRVADKAKIDFDYKLHKLGSADTNVSYIIDKSNSIRITDDNGISIGFERTGECKLYNKDGTDNSGDITGITFFNATRDKTIRILPTLGKHYMK